MFRVEWPAHSEGERSRFFDRITQIGLTFELAKKKSRAAISLTAGEAER